MCINKRLKAFRALGVFATTTLILFFQNCSGSFKSVTQETNSNSTGQSTSGNGTVTPALPGGTPVVPVTPVDDYGNYKPITGFTNLVNLNSRICNIDISGSVSCIGSLDAGNALGFFADRLTNMNFNLNVKQLLDNCVLTANEKVFCYGSNYNGELGLTPRNPLYSATPLEINLGEPVKSMAQVAGGICASLASGVVKCWGQRLDLPLVDGSLQVIGTPALVSGLTNVKQVFANLYPRQFCALSNTNDVFCWGQTIESVDGSISQYPGPTKVLNASGIKKIIAGAAEKFCILFDNSQLSCFKSKETSSAMINLEPKLNQVAEITSNEGTRCAKLQSGDVYCWGTNMFGRLGFVRKHSESITAPVLIPEWKNAISLSASMYNTCALMADTTIKCLGLANGSFKDNMRIETNLSQLGVNENVIAVAPSDYYGICYQTATGVVRCLMPVTSASDFTIASEAYQKVGNEILSKPVTIPEASLNSFVFLSKKNGSGEAVLGGCYIDPVKTLKCFGDNQYGQLGNGSTTFSSLPMTVLGLTNVVKVQDSEGRSRCALTSQNRLYCWGSSVSGLFNLFDLNDSQYNAPVEVTKVGAIKDFFLDYGSLTVIQTDGVVKTYGAYDHFDIAGAKQYDYKSGCAQMNDNSVSCYAAAIDATPAGYKKINGISSATLKFFGSCVVNESKSVQCWGDNKYGQLGQGDRQTYASAMTVKGIANASAVFQDEARSTCAYVDENLGNQSRILCWGSSSQGSNLSLGVYEKTNLRGYKPVLNSNGRSFQVLSYLGPAGQLKTFNTLRIPTAPFVLLQTK